MAIFSNQATLTYAGGSTSSNIVVGEILDLLSMTKTAVGDTYRAGDTVSYVISLVNGGTTALSGLTLTDDLGAYPFGTGTVTPLTYVDGSLVYYQNGAIATAPTVTAGPPLTITGIDIPAPASINGVAIGVIERPVEAFALATGSRNTASVIRLRTVRKIQSGRICAAGVKSMIDAFKLR